MGAFSIMGDYFKRFYVTFQFRNVILIRKHDISGIHMAVTPIYFLICIFASLRNFRCLNSELFLKAERILRKKCPLRTVRRTMNETKERGRESIDQERKGHMGICLNPGQEGFEEALNSEIYMDKTGLIAYTNRVLGSPEKISVSAGRDVLARRWRLRCLRLIMIVIMMRGICFPD